MDEGDDALENKDVKVGLQYSPEILDLFTIEGKKAEILPFGGENKKYAGSKKPAQDTIRYKLREYIDRRCRIILRQYKNPKRKRKIAETYSRYRTGMTVGEFCDYFDTYIEGAGHVCWDFNRDYIDLIPPDKPVSDELLRTEFEKGVQKSVRDPRGRKVRLEQASKIPLRILVTGFAFIRNADVVAEVLGQARGVCQGCNARAPFFRKSDNSPYLEVHHKITLACGGEDTVKNAIALCPNCHRRAHYG